MIKLILRRDLPIPFLIHVRQTVRRGVIREICISYEDLSRKYPSAAIAAFLEIQRILYNKCIICFNVKIWSPISGVSFQLKQVACPRNTIVCSITDMINWKKIFNGISCVYARKRIQSHANFIKFQHANQHLLAETLQPHRCLASHEKKCLRFRAAYKCIA